MNKIEVIKIGNVVNLSINGKLYNKKFNTPDDANNLFRLALNAKQNPKEYLNKLINEISLLQRVKHLKDFEIDDLGNVYLAGFNTPVPSQIVSVVQDYLNNNFPITSIVNFWKTLMLNSDPHVRSNIMDFISAHDFSITDNGYLLTYKAVYVKEKIKTKQPKNTDNQYSQELIDFVNNIIQRVKKVWKSSPKNYSVFYDNNNNKYIVSERLESFPISFNCELIGNLYSLYEEIKEMSNNPVVVNQEEKTIYTDMFSQSMRIEIGVPVKQDRKECDSNHSNECSNGLHVGATKYVQSYANSYSVILLCLVNPMNIISVPNYDKTKMRVSEYFPIGVVDFDYDTKKITAVKQSYYENDYMNYELKEIDKLHNKVLNEQCPFEPTLSGVIDDRSLDELKKIVETRVVDLSYSVSNETVVTS